MRFARAAVRMRPQQAGRSRAATSHHSVGHMASRLALASTRTFHKALIRGRILCNAGRILHARSPYNRLFASSAAALGLWLNEKNKGPPLIAIDRSRKALHQHARRRCCHVTATPSRREAAGDEVSEEDDDAVRLRTWKRLLVAVLDPTQILNVKIRKRKSFQTLNPKR